MRAEADVRASRRSETVREDDQRIRTGPRRILDRSDDFLVALRVGPPPLGDDAHRRFPCFAGIARPRRLIGVELIRCGAAGENCEREESETNETANHVSSGITDVRTRSGAYWAMRTLTKTSTPPAMTVPLTRSPRSTIAAANVTSGSRYSNTATRETSTRSSAPYQNRYPRAEHPLARNTSAPQPTGVSCGNSRQPRCTRKNGVSMAAPNSIAPEVARRGPRSRSVACPITE